MEFEILGGKTQKLGEFWAKGYNFRKKEKKEEKFGIKGKFLEKGKKKGVNFGEKEKKVDNFGEWR